MAWRQQGSAASAVPWPSLLAQHTGSCHSVTSSICPEHTLQQQETIAFPWASPSLGTASRADKWGLAAGTECCAVLNRARPPGMICLASSSPVGKCQPCTVPGILCWPGDAGQQCSQPCAEVPWGWFGPGDGEVAHSVQGCC